MDELHHMLIMYSLLRYHVLPSDLKFSTLQVMFVLFAALAAIWGLVIYRAGSQSLRVHHLMGVLIVAKTLTLLSLAGMYHLIRARGHPEGWNIAYYLFTFLRGLLFFTVNHHPIWLKVIL